MLFVLEKKPGAMLKDLSEELGINATVITALIDRMEDAGRVRRQPSNEDGRAALLFCDPRCARQGCGGAAPSRPHERAPHAGLSERNIATIARFFNALLKRF